MRDLQQLRREATGPALFAVTYELAHLDADLNWIEQSGTRLEAITADMREGFRDA